MLVLAEDEFTNIRCKVDEDFLEYPKIRRILTSLNMQASPGYPLCIQYPTIGDMFDWDGVDISEAKAVMFYQQFMVFVNGKVKFPFKVFIKNEPHKRAKIEKNKWRLIFSAPLYLQVLDHALFDDIIQKEVDEMWRIPIKTGWNPFYGGSELLVQQFTDPYGLDASQWDWSVMEWLIKFFEHLDHRLVDANERWHELVSYSYKYSFYDAEIILSNGNKYRQVFPGLMKSGLVRTLSNNSRGSWAVQMVAAMRAGARLPLVWTIGDDVKRTKITDEESRELDKLIVVKEYENNYEFAGFDCSTKIPLYWSKHYYKLLYSENLVESLESYQRLYCYSDLKFALVQKILRELDVTKLRSRKYCQYQSMYRPLDYLILDY